MEIKKILKENNFIFEKKFGQNFLTDENLLSSVVSRSGVDNNSTIIEIGVGAGTLTREIAKQCKKVYGFEIDTKLKPILDKTLKDFSNIEIIFKDIMKMPITEIENLIGGKYTLIANLPYYITTPIIMKFIEEAENCERIVVTIQKEVAERICAKPKTSDYGAITASINAVADSEIIEYIPREKFLPVPNVDSSVVKITLNKTKYDIYDIKKYRQLIKSAFSMRRKTLINNLLKNYDIAKSDIEGILNKLGISLSVRGEELDSLDYINLLNELKEFNL